MSGWFVPVALWNGCSLNPEKPGVLHGLGVVELSSAQPQEGTRALAVSPSRAQLPE